MKVIVVDHRYPAAEKPWTTAKLTETSIRHRERLPVVAPSTLRFRPNVIYVTPLAPPQILRSHGDSVYFENVVYPYPFTGEWHSRLLIKSTRRRRKARVPEARSKERPSLCVM